MINVTYDTVEKKYKSEKTFSYVTKDAALSPIMIIRSSCGRGSASKRYFYEAVFKAPVDARFVTNGRIRENVVRKKNPLFNPKHYTFIGNVAKLY